MSISSTTGAITGTPNAVFSTASITIEATNSGGSDSTTISITVDDQAPAISYAGSPFTILNNSILADISPQNVGGYSGNWSQSNGTLPAGLTLNMTTGVISGTPVLAPIYANLTVIASNSGGSDSFALQFIIIQDETTPSDNEDSDKWIIFRYITNDPIVIVKGISILLAICLVLAALMIGYGVRAINETDLTEEKKSEIATYYDKLYRDSHKVVPDWDKVGMPQQALSSLNTKINALESATIPESKHLKKAKRNFIVMRAELKTPAAATPYLRSILTSILRAYREHLRTALANTELKGKISLEQRGAVILREIEDGLSPKAKKKHVYKKLLNAGFIEKETVNLFPELSKLMKRLNKAIHLEDPDSSLLEEDDFIHAIVLIQKFLTSGFR